MTLYIGHILAFFSVIINFINLIIYYINTKKNSLLLQRIFILFSRINFISISLAFISLIYLYINSDFRNLNVFLNSHSAKPLIYKFSGTWGNHEGSLLMWILIMSAYTFIFSFNKTLNKKLINLTIFFQIIMTSCFLIFMILTSNPFIINSTNINEGMGLNPILQDPALAIHPPLLYLGYVGFSLVLSLAVAGLITDKIEKDWIKTVKKYSIFCWVMLTLGIAAGSFWAYYELGWGGWWFWDPVENASLMPWLIGTALLHSLITVEKKKSLQSWVLLLSILAFLLSVLGTFLVRSGVLTSVHTFALDPSRGLYILAFTALLGGYSLTLFGLKSKKYLNNSYFSFFSREGSILVNNILMIVVCLSVFLGTVYPLLVEAFTNNKISVGEPYYNATVVPIMIPAILIMGVGPILSWGNQNKLKTFKKIFPSFLFTVIVTIFISLFYGSYSFIGIIGIGLAFWIISNNIIILFQKVTNRLKSMIVAHLGIGLLILGITGSSVWQEEKIIKMKIDEKTKIEKYNIVFDKINEIRGPNYVALQGIFFVYDSKKNIVTKLKPENRFYPIENNFTTEASIHTNLFRDLYIVLGEGNSNDGWVVRIYYNPLVIWIWIGALVIFLGGITSININLKKLKILS